jgi:hypothetical protein
MPKKKSEPSPKNEGNQEIRDLLKQEMNLQEYEQLEANKIHWIDNKFYDSWDKIKGRFHNIIQPSPKEKMEKTNIPKIPKWFFLAHSQDVVRGKPQLVDTILKTIPLIRLTSPIESEGKGNDKWEYRTAKYTFFDERYDKRYDGALLDSFCMDFWTYKIVTEDGKEVFIWTQEKLPNCTCTFRGMLVPLDDWSELSRSLKIKSLSKVFFLNSYEPDNKILNKEGLVSFVKQKQVDETDWNFLLSYHPTGNLNLFDDDIMRLRSAFLLSGRYDGYPLHLAFMGTAGTKKSWGHLGTLDFKFNKNSNIVGGGNTRAKALVPSFKEKPCNIGYFARTERVGFIDELCKMAEIELNKHQTNVQNLFGEWNDLLDNLKRMVGSGNDNSAEIEATSKNLFVTNPLSNRRTLDRHIGVLDSSMMSRILWFVQDEAESEFLRSPHSVYRISPQTSTRPFKVPENSPHTYTSILGLLGGIQNTNKKQGLYMCWGKIERKDFLTIFDSTNAFTCDIPFEQVEKLVNVVTALAKEPMKSSVWKPRAEHHTYLLIDGIVKTRCLFRDYDPTFTPKKEDYDTAERLLIRMVKSWDTDLSPKEDK